MLNLIQNYILENCEGRVKLITDDIVSEFIGEDEIKASSVMLKDMETGNQELVKIDELVNYIAEKIKY